jgi:hypothetical protein
LCKRSFEALWNVNQVVINERIDVKVEPIHGKCPANFRDLFGLTFKLEMLLFDLDENIYKHWLKKAMNVHSVMICNGDLWLLRLPPQC